MYFSPGFNPPPLSGAPVVFTIHDLIQIDVADVATPAKRLYFECIVRPACRRAARVLTVSEYSRTRILEWSGAPPEHVVNVGNGVSAEFQPDGPRHEPGFPYLLYVGNFRPHKNLGRLFEAFARAHCPGLRLIVVADPPRDIEERLHRLRIADRTSFIRSISDEALAALYRGALALVLPSLVEGFGLTALEAMACGTPAIVSNTAALPEVAGDAALYIDPLDPECLSSAIECAADSPALRESLRTRGLERAKQFSWDRVAGRVLDILEDAAH